VNEGARDKVTKRRGGNGKFNREGAPGPLAKEGGQRDFLKYLCRGPRVPGYATADGFGRPS